jgi:hypothetical protein
MYRARHVDHKGGERSASTAFVSTDTPYDFEHSQSSNYPNDLQQQHELKMRSALLTLNTRGPQGHVEKSVASEVRVVS